MFISNMLLGKIKIVMTLVIAILCVPWMLFVKPL